MVEIGNEDEPYTIEPIENPIPDAPAPAAPEPVVEPEPELVPA